MHILYTLSVIKEEDGEISQTSIKRAVTRRSFGEQEDFGGRRQVNSYKLS